MNDNKMREKIAEHRNELDSLADSDLPANWIAEVLIKIGSSSSASASREESQ